MEKRRKEAFILVILMVLQIIQEIGKDVIRGAIKEVSKNIWNEIVESVIRSLINEFLKSYLKFNLENGQIITKVNSVEVGVTEESSWIELEEEIFNIFLEIVHLRLL